MMLNEKIRELRRERDMTQEQLAEAMGVSTASVSKWENGQSAPELTALMALADFFEVSVDTLLGHRVDGDRKNGLIREMKALDKEDRNGEARALAEKLLRGYPNDAEVVEEAANVYANCYVRGGDRANMEQAIALTKRLFTLAEDKTGMKRFELLSTLGNRYELLCEWETARKYYQEGNVGKCNDRALARLLTNEERHEEAVEEISRIFFYDLFNMIIDILLLTNSWKKLEQPGKAAAALKWGIGIIENVGEKTRKDLAPLETLLREQRDSLGTVRAEDFLTGVEFTVATEGHENEKGVSSIRISL